MWGGVPDIVRNAKAEEVATELRAQVQAGRSSSACR